jgi:hypothetical protein
MGNTSVKAHQYGRSGHKRSGHKHSRQCGHKRHAFRTRRHHRYGGGLSPLNPAATKTITASGRKTKKKHIDLRTEVLIKSAHSVDAEIDRQKAKATEDKRKRKETLEKSKMQNEAARVRAQSDASQKLLKSQQKSNPHMYKSSSKK